MFGYRKRLLPACQHLVFSGLLDVPLTLEKLCGNHALRNMGTGGCQAASRQVEAHSRLVPTRQYVKARIDRERGLE